VPVSLQHGPIIRPHLIDDEHHHQARRLVLAPQLQSVVRAGTTLSVQFASELGVNGVPFFVIDRRYALSGAQDAEVFLEVLETAWASRDNRRSNAPAGSTW